MYAASRNKPKTLAFILIFTIHLSCNSKKQNGNDQSLEVKIGNQIWSSHNLNVDCFRNGDKIAQAKTDDDWVLACERNIPVWCYYKNDEINGLKTGKLYNYSAVFDARNLAPHGWKVPSALDFEELISNAGGEFDAPKRLKMEDAWGNEDCSNKYGFSIIPSGFRNFYGFDWNNNSSNFWTTTVSNELLDGVYYFNFYSNQDVITKKSIDKIYWGFSIRCLKE